MYFIKYHPLKDQLRKRTITDREALPYFVIFTALTALVCGFPLTHGFNSWDTVSVFMSTGLAIGGVMYAYLNNGGSRGYDLIQKYVVLGWVVSVRCILALIPLGIFLYLIGEFMGLIDSEATGWFDVAIIAIMEIILYQRIGRHIKDTYDENSEHVPPVQPRSGAH